MEYEGETYTEMGRLTPNLCVKLGNNSKLEMTNMACPDNDDEFDINYFGEDCMGLSIVSSFPDDINWSSRSEGVSYSGDSDDPTNATVNLTNCKFWVSNTGLSVESDVTLAATDCTFIGGIEGARLLKGSSTFDNCSFNLYDYGTWSDNGTDYTPQAALVIGKSGETDNPKSVELKNACTFSVMKYDSSNKEYENSTEHPFILNNANLTIPADAASETNYKAAGKQSDE